jgi:hypothetical protein
LRFDVERAGAETRAQTRKRAVAERRPALFADSTARRYLGKVEGVFGESGELLPELGDVAVSHEVPGFG